MTTKTATNSIQRILLSVIGSMFTLSVVFVSPVFMQQQGGPYTMTKAVVAGGGSSSTNNNTSLTGTIAQGVLGISSANNFSLNAGFWQNDPAGTQTISGNITYCAASTPVGVPNVQLNLTGTTSSSTNSDVAGNYQFSALPPSGGYTVTPSKGGAVSGINAQDIGRIRRFVALLDTPSPCQTIAGNVDNANPSVNAQDVGVLRRYVALLPNTGDAGTWKFNPPNVTVAGQPGSQTANFEAILVGDVDGNWIPSSPQGKPSSQLPTVSLSVSFPNTSANQGVTVFVPVTVSGTLTPGDNVLGYTLDLTFNQSVVATVADPGQSFSTAGTISASGTVTENKTLSTNRLRLVVDFNNPLVFSGTQTLIYIKLNVIGSPGQVSNLSWNAALPPEFGNGPPSITTTPVDGSLTVNNPSAVRLSSFSATGYDNGVFLEWKTGLEVDNLGFKIYRESGGRRELLNPGVIAGSALLTGAAQLKTGRSYTWWDSANNQAAQYWLEDLDLNGNRSLHGPFGIQQKSGKPLTRSVAATLSQIGRNPARSTQATSIHQIAGSETRLQQQQELSAASAVKITIREEGWYSVKRADLVAAGLDPNAEAGSLQLFLHGQGVPISVVGEESHSFDSIEFYGTGQDTPSTDAHVYWLTSTGKNGMRIKHVKGEGAQQTATSFPFTVERKDRTIYFSGLRNGDKENFFGPVISTVPVEQTLTVSHLASNSSAPARVEIKLQGVTEVSHTVGVQLNGTFVGQVSFTGRAEGSLTVDPPQSLLSEGINIISLTGQGGPSDISLVGSIRITYQHTFTADDDSLRFIASGNQEVRIAGFSSSAVRVIDITDLDSPTEIDGKVEDDKSGFAITVTSPEAGNRTLIAFSDSDKHPASLAVNVPSNWRQKEQAADLVIIARRDFFSAADTLTSARQKQGFKVALVDIEDIYDEFNYGEKSPQTVKDFLTFAGANWKLAPRFVLMLGDASFDSRNYLGAGDFDLVPTKLVDTEFMETSSDDWLADFNNDGLPEMAMGRLPARTSDEAEVMIKKVLNYASGRTSEEALLVADLNDGYDFESATRQLRPLLPSSLRIEEIDRGALDPTTAKRQLLEGLVRGPLVVNYAGHGNVDLWRGELLTHADAGSLANSERPTVFVMMTCLNGYFQDPVLDGLAESLMKVEAGGAVAVWASSGMTLPMEQWLMNQELYRLLFGRGSLGAPPMTLGEAVVRAKASIGDQDIRRTWILFGDPTMRVR
jgi:hypothetical protein